MTSSFLILFFLFIEKTEHPISSYFSRKYYLSIYIKLFVFNFCNKKLCRPNNSEKMLMMKQEFFEAPINYDNSPGVIIVFIAIILIRISKLCNLKTNY